jgi:predicted Zn-dependent protease
MQAMTVPVVFGGAAGPTGNSTSDNNLSVPLTYLKYSRDDESAADYFGVQYLYKSGYSPECFISFIQKVWPSQAQPTAKAFSRFPPLPERLQSLRREIQEILPQQIAVITNTEHFATFREHLLTLAPPPKPVTKNPTLLGPEGEKLN